MVEERRPLPESIRGLVDVAVHAYRRRVRLYCGVAIVGLIFEALVVGFFRPGFMGIVRIDSVIQGGSIVIDSLISTLVTIGVVADMRHDERPTDGTIIDLTLQRWGLVAVVATLVGTVTYFSSNAVFGAPDDTEYGLLILPIIIAWGSLGFASVIAATDTKTPPFILVWSSIGRSMSLALSRQNIGRLIPLAIVAVLPAFVEAVLADQLHVRKIAAWEFIGNIPIDVLVTGPIQAVFTIFYLDFVRRTNSPGKS